jgi:hypothetical protein
VVNEGGMAKVVRGVGNVRFQLKFGELLEFYGVLFVPGLRVNLLSFSTLEDVRYCILFKREHVFIYRHEVDPIELQLISNCWLWGLIMFLIQRSLLSVMFIPHEDFTPQKYVHSSTRGSEEEGYPLYGVRGGYPLGWGVQG